MDLINIDIQRIRKASADGNISADDTKKLTSYARLFIEHAKLDSKKNSPEFDALLERALKIPQLAEILNSEDSDE